MGDSTSGDIPVMFFCPSWNAQPEDGTKMDGYSGNTEALAVPHRSHLEADEFRAHTVAVSLPGRQLIRRQYGARRDVRSRLKADLHDRKHAAA